MDTAEMYYKVVINNCYKVTRLLYQSVPIVYETKANYFGKSAVPLIISASVKRRKTEDDFWANIFHAWPPSFVAHGMLILPLIVSRDFGNGF